MKFVFITVFAIASVTSAAIRTNYKRIISFGDSLSDTGTYSKTAAPYGGGKYTTNPGKIWIEFVATELGLSIKPNRYEGFGIPTQIADGLDYAQGGARVTVDGVKTINSNVPTARSIATQIGYFVHQYARFSTTDLVFIQGGANDVFAQVSALKENKITPAEAIKNMIQAATDLSAHVRNLKQLGAVNLFVFNLPMIEKTPFGLSLPPQMQSLVAQMIQSFNANLKGSLRSSGAALLDVYTFDGLISQNPTKYGLRNVTQPACNLKVVNAGTSLFCNATTLMEPSADKFFKYADAVHPSTGFSVLIAQFALSEVVRRAR